MENNQETKTAASVAAKIAAANTLLNEALQEAQSMDKTAIVPTEVVTGMTSLTTTAMAIFSEYCKPLYPTERMRRIGSRAKNYGFMQMAYNSAIANPTLVPGFLNMEEFWNELSSYAMKRTLVTQITQYHQLVADSMMDNSDIAYHDALQYYGYIKAAAGHRVPGAESEFNVMRVYFQRSKNTIEDTEPTNAKLERDVRALLKGNKEGQVVIQNTKPTITRGKRIVSDTTYSDHSTTSSITEVDKKD